MDISPSELDIASRSRACCPPSASSTASTARRPLRSCRTFPASSRFDRTSMNAFEDRAFSDAVKKTGRKRLIIGGLHTEICLRFAVQALRDGYEGIFVADAVGGAITVPHRTAIERMADAGAVPNTALAVVTELFGDWASGPLAGKARKVIYWYFGEVTKLKADGGVSEVEKQAAAEENT
jgi:Isochorismatase family